VFTSFPSISRRESRYDLCLPVALKVAESASETSGLSENISLHGVLVATKSPIREGTEVELVITLPRAQTVRNARLEASGRVLRSEQRESNTFAVAVFCAEHPFRFTSAG
jgi:PilZ domain